MITWLADALRAEGVSVVEHDGWRTRGRSGFDPHGVVCHHTAGPKSGDAPSLNVCINGRSDLPGPLCHIVLARSGRAHVIAAGKANHAGAGGWKGLAGNASVVGIEAENTGVGEPWTKAQLDAYIRCCAAICRRLGVDAGMVCAHREWAPGRKIDPAGLDMPWFRLKIKERLEADMPLSDADLEKIRAIIQEENAILYARVRGNATRLRATLAALFRKGHPGT